MAKNESADTIGPPAMAALVAGGMVGGGIYVALGVIVDAAGQWAWLSFVIAGIIAVITANSYALLSNHFETDGGAFGFLEKMNREGAAGSLSWILIIAYTLTLALYAFAFGEYVAHAFGGNPVLTRVLSVAAIAALAGLNLLGVGKLTKVEITIVSANLLILVGLGVAGVLDWEPAQLIPASGPKAAWASVMGAAVTFVSYEGFQLLTYEYDEVKDPKKTLQPTMVFSAMAVVGIYVLVALGATMIVGGDVVIAKKSVALSVVGEAKFGTAGLIAMTVAAGFATAAAINSTLFSTGKLAERVAEDGELPSWMDHRNSENIPDHAVLLIAGVAAVLSVTGSLSSLVEAASVVFLAAFSAVNVIALRECEGRKWVAWTGIGLGAVVGAVLIYRLVTTKPVALGIVLVLVAACIWLRPWLLSKFDVEHSD